jgi:voltage-gated potassium channel
MMWSGKPAIRVFPPARTCTLAQPARRDACSLEFLLEEVAVRAGSRLAGRTLREANAGETSGALVLALRGRDGTFLANPPMQTPIDTGYRLIAIGTRQQLAALQHPPNQVG